jgi:hypothetical protein
MLFPLALKVNMGLLIKYIYSREILPGYPSSLTELKRFAKS